MPRRPRIQFPGALYHVTSRGDRKEPIFSDDYDRNIFLEVIGKAAERFNLSFLAYCLMGNHYHLVMLTRDGNLSRAMRYVNGVYTQKFNRRHGTCGHVFQGRFNAGLIQADDYLVEACRYVELNPVRARLVRDPHEWEWSSYRAHIGLAQSPQWLASGLVEDGDDVARMQARHISLVQSARL